MIKETKPMYFERDSLLIDGVNQEFTVKTNLGLGNIWYIAKPKGKIINRFKGAIRVLIGKSIAVHFAEDDPYINLR